MNKFITVVVACVACINVSASPIFYWGSDGGLDLTAGDVYYKDGALVAASSDWLVELVNVADDTVLYSVTDGFQDGAGLFYADVVDADGWNGLSVKTVIYDANIKEDADFFAEFTQQYAISWGSPTPPTISDYYAGEVTATLGSNPGQWQAIPEPTVAALIGLFGGGMLVARRLFAKEA